MNVLLDNEQLSFNDVLLSPGYSEITSRKNTSLYQRKAVGKHSLKIPILSSNMDTITEFSMAFHMAEMGAMGINHRYMTIHELADLAETWFVNSLHPFAVSVGCVKNDQGRINFLLRNYKENNIIICIDIAHGDSKNLKDTVKYIRDEGFEGTLIGGNVCTFEGTQRLFDWGVDVVKVGVGPGSACTTRVKTGCGFPQFSAITECSKAGPIIADGGIKTPGDAAKALAAGATTVMVGGMLAGTDHTPEGKSSLDTVTFRGMASREARNSFNGKVSNVEGISCLVKTKPKGSTKRVLYNMIEGIKSAMSYVGASTLPEFREKATFVRVTQATKYENTPHILGTDNV